MSSFVKTFNVYFLIDQKVTEIYIHLFHFSLFDYYSSLLHFDGFLFYPSVFSEYLELLNVFLYLQIA